MLDKIFFGQFTKEISPSASLQLVQMKSFLWRVYADIHLFHSNQEACSISQLYEDFLHNFSTYVQF
jgi:hypothetical protein